MARTLDALIMASGYAGTSGQSFRNHVTGATTGTKMSDYICSAISFTGQPVNDAGTYGSNTLFNITTTITRQSMFYHIQQNTSAAWTFGCSSSAGVGASATLETFSAGGSPAGATHALGLRVKGAFVSASPSELTSADQVGSSPPDGDPWAVTFTASISGIGSAGSTTLTISKTYDPNIANFNDDLTGGADWTAPVTNRQLDQDVDFSYEWRSATAGGGTLYSTARSFTLTGDTGRYVYSGSDDGLINNGTGDNDCTIYVRWRWNTTSGGPGTWNDDSVYKHDERPDV